MAEVLIPFRLRGDLEFGVVVDDQNEHVIAGYGQNSGLATIRCELHGPSNYRLLLWLGPGEQQRVEIPGNLNLRRVTQLLTNWHTGAQVEVLNYPFLRIVVERIFAVPLRGSPTVLSVTETENGAGGTSLNFALPSVVDPNDFLIACHQWGYASASANAISTPSGWTTIQQASGTYCGMGVQALDAVGTEDGSNVNVTWSISVSAFHYVFRIQAGTWGGTEATCAEAAITASTTSGTVNPPNLAPSWGSKDCLWIANGFVDTTASSTLTGPTDYTVQGQYAYQYSDWVSGAVSTRFVTAASQDPGTFSGQTGTLAEWRAMTVAVQPSAVAYEQEGYRFYDDDGDEDASTPLGNQGAPITVASETPFRVRVLGNVSGDPGSHQATVQYRKVGDPASEWETIA